MKTGSSVSLCFLAIGLALGGASLPAQPPESDNKGQRPALARSLLGAWVLVGKPGNVGEPKPGARMKSGNAWVSNVR